MEYLIQLSIHCSLTKKSTNKNTKYVEQITQLEKAIKIWESAKNV